MLTFQTPLRRLSPARRHGTATLTIIVFVAALALILVLLLKPGFESNSHGLVQWRSDVAAASADARTEGKPVLLFFTADWCGPCQTLKRNVFSQQAVADHIHQRSVPVLVDLTSPDDQQRSIASRYQVQSIPTLIVIDADGKVVSRTIGAQPAQALTGWLDAAVTSIPDKTAATAN